MTYERIKIIKGRPYRYLQKSYRDAKGNPRTKHIKYLGAGRTTQKKEPTKHKTTHAKSNLTELEQQFLKDVDYKNAKKESQYTNIDGKIHKKLGTTTKVSAYDVVDEFMAHNIESIHNHPLEIPPSNNDIFTILYSGNTKRTSIILPSGRLYTLTRNKNTRKLSGVSSDKVREHGRTDGVIKSLNTDKRSAMRSFGRTYNQYARIEMTHLGIKTKDDMKKHNAELHQSVLYRMAKTYDFDIQEQMVS